MDHGWLIELWRKGKADYLGEWHFHPFSSPELSLIDHRQMQDMSPKRAFFVSKDLITHIVTK
jgi:hypothetical protein